MSAELDRSKILVSARFRPMTLVDVPAVIAVERSAYPFPWSDGVFRDCIRVGYLCRVVECLGEVGGYGIMSYGAGEAHILNICIREDLRGGGLGRRLMLYLIDRARGAGMQDAFLEVRPSNQIALRLYASVGFEQIGVRPAYYQAENGREDAVILAATLQTPR